MADVLIRPSSSGCPGNLIESGLSHISFSRNVNSNGTAVTIEVFRAQADWTLTHTSHKDTEQSTIEASITLNGVTLTDLLIR
jgi:hypothetical protein